MYKKLASTLTVLAELALMHNTMCAQSKVETKPVPVMPARITDAAKFLTSFNKDKSPDDLVNAVKAMEQGTSELLKNPPSTSVSKNAFVMWLNILAALDHSIDPKYDPDALENLPFMNLMPPPNSDGTPPPYPSGVSPEDIKDPKVRAKYEKAIKNNEAKKERANFQITLRELDWRASFNAEIFLRELQTSSTLNRKQLIDILDSSAVSKARKEQMIKLVAK